MPKRAAQLGRSLHRGGGPSPSLERLEFQRALSRHAFAYRRSVIKAAISKVRSYLSNYARRLAYSRRHDLVR